MFSKSLAIQKGAEVKAKVDAVHAAIDALPAGPEKDEAQAAFEALHLVLNGLARRAARFFDDDIETFSGGNDRPDGE
jgi:hypothetical protein